MQILAKQHSIYADFQQLHHTTA